MRKLFIIGTEFDQSHNLPTGYNDFKEYLLDSYMIDKEELEQLPEIPEVETMPDGDTYCDKAAVARLLVYLISEVEPEGIAKWGEVETSLGRLDYDEIFDMLPDEYDRDGDVDYWGTAANNEDMASNLSVYIPYVKDFFHDWIDTIDISDVKANEDFEKIIGAQDLFLQFNYTETLQQVYHVSDANICHIHGKQGEDILFGHGNSDDHYEQNMSSHIGSESNLSLLHGFLKKDTRQALRAHMGFFNQIDASVEAIYSHGFGFSDVDLIYIKEICKRIPNNVVWYLNDYDKKLFPEYQSTIRKCGFRGEFDSFHI